MRPIEADNRSEIGHWEGDTVLGYKERSVLLTLVDWRSRYLVSKKIPNKESSTTREAIEELLRQSRLPIKTITFDQGTEFAEGAQMEQELNTDVYFAHPGSPWERHTNENTNGLLRQFVPKRHSISALTDDDIQRIVAKLNFRPRKCLGWKTPYEVAFNQVLHLT